MSLELRVPAVGESITEVQVGEWLKKEGDAVRRDEAVVLIESEKATVELPSPADGVLHRILRQRGEVAKVGEVLAELSDARTPQGVPTPPQSASATAPAESPPPTPTAVVMPAAQRILAEAGLTASKVTGSGPGGRITKDDALRAVEALGSQAAAAPTPGPGPEATATPAPVQPGPPMPLSQTQPSVSDSDDVTVGPPDEVVPMSPLRRTVARRLVEAQSAMAMLTTFNEIDMSRVMALRRHYQEAFQARHGVKLGFMSFFVKAVIEGLKETPGLNAEVREPNFVYHRTYDIGVAIGGGKGLVVPVIRQAERLGFAHIEKLIADFGTRAREGKIQPDELRGGTFTISNGGVYGSLLSTPIINPPQSGILGMHAIQDRAVVVEGQVAVRPMMYVALTYDHRIVDGREAVTFLKRIKEIVEDPARLLLEA